MLSYSSLIQIYEKRIMYDGSNEAVSCSIDSNNEGKSCSVRNLFHTLIWNLFMYCSFLILLQHCSWYLHSMRMLMVQSMCTMSWRTSTRTTAAMSAVGILISSREMYVLYCVLHCTILLCTAPLMFYTILYNINFYTHYYYHTLLL